MILEITIVKMLPEMALVEGIVTVEDTVVTKGKLASRVRQSEPLKRNLFWPRIDMTATPTVSDARTESQFDLLSQSGTVQSKL